MKHGVNGFLKKKKNNDNNKEDKYRINKGNTL